jgi:hypothetical protein
MTGALAPFSYLVVYSEHPVLGWVPNCIQIFALFALLALSAHSLIARPLCSLTAHPLSHCALVYVPVYRRDKQACMHVYMHHRRVLAWWILADVGTKKLEVRWVVSHPPHSFKLNIFSLTVLFFPLRTKPFLIENFRPVRNPVNFSPPGNSFRRGNKRVGPKTFFGFVGAKQFLGDLGSVFHR